jgi:transposase
MGHSHRRHDISDEVWALLEPHLPGRSGVWGGVAKDNRLFINAVFWILRTGAPWRDLPPDYGGWSNAHRRFIRWRDAGVWEKLLETLIDEPDYEWLMIDASHCKVHPCARSDGGAVFRGCGGFNLVESEDGGETERRGEGFRCGSHGAVNLQQRFETGFGPGNRRV